MPAVITKAADSVTLILNGRAITDYVAGDTIIIAYENPLTSHIVGSAGGVNISGRTDAMVGTITYRLMKRSDDDTWMSRLMAQEFPILFNGSMKENYKIEGQPRIATYMLENGSIMTQPTDTMNDTEGNASMEYVIKFNKIIRMQ